MAQELKATRFELATPILVMWLKYSNFKQAVLLPRVNKMYQLFTAFHYPPRLASISQFTTTFVPPKLNLRGNSFVLIRLSVINDNMRHACNPIVLDYATHISKRKGFCSTSSLQNGGTNVSLELFLSTDISTCYVTLARSPKWTSKDRIEYDHGNLEQHFLKRQASYNNVKYENVSMN